LLASVNRAGGELVLSFHLVLNLTADGADQNGLRGRSESLFRHLQPQKR
jgi:hypothetical protein